MDDSLASEQPADRHAEDAVQASAPDMPVIRQSEKLPYGNPYPLLDGLPRTIGWVWRSSTGGDSNAVVAMRFDCNEIGDIMSEIAAYGTAVTVEPVQPAPTVTTLEAG